MMIGLNTHRQFKRYYVANISYGVQEGSACAKTIWPKCTNDDSLRGSDKAMAVHSLIFQQR